MFLTILMFGINNDTEYEIIKSDILNFTNIQSASE